MRCDVLEITPQRVVDGEHHRHVELEVGHVVLLVVADVASRYPNRNREYQHARRRRFADPGE